MLTRIKQQWMLTAAFIAALVSMLIVPPDEQYLSYFDWKTIGCLFCVLAVASAFRREGAFERVAAAAIAHIKNPCLLTLTTVFITAIFSMAFTNDVALIIMLPLSLAMLIKLGCVHMTPVVFALQTLAANLCGMITPFGNPQNLYLYTYFHIGLLDFLNTMALPFVLSTVAIFAVAFCATRHETTGTNSVKSVKSVETVESIHSIDSGELVDAPGQPDTTASAGSPKAQTKTNPRRNVIHIAIYSALFVIALLAVFRAIPYLISVVIIAAALLITDRKALARVDYGLLATFICFFIFAGNMARIPILEDILSPLMNEWGLLVSAVTSQVISNVPAAVVLSHFTTNWQQLLIGVNIGGAGSFVGSLASLITIRFFILARKEFIPRCEKKELTTSKFLLLFGLMNAAFFILLLVVFQIIWAQ